MLFRKKQVEPKNTFLHFFVMLFRKKQVEPKNNVCLIVVLFYFVDQRFLLSRKKRFQNVNMYDEVFSRFFFASVVSK